MHRGKLRIIGIFLSVLGLFFMVTSPVSMTGSTVLGKFLSNSGSFAGVVFLFLGIFSFLLSHESSKSLERISKSHSVKKVLETAYWNLPDTRRGLKRVLSEAGYEIKGNRGDPITILYNNKIMKKKDGLPILIPNKRKIKKYKVQVILENLLGYKPKK